MSILVRARWRLAWGGGRRLVWGAAGRRSVRRAVEAGADVVAWMGGLLMAAGATDDLGRVHPAGSELAETAVGVCVMTVGCGLLAGLYRGHYLRGSRDEVAAVSLAGFLTVCCLSATGSVLVAGQRALLGTVLGGAVFAVVAMLGARYVAFAARLRSRPPDPTATKIIVFGAGDAGAMRDPRISDLLGRPAATTDAAQVREHIAGKRVLVTGAGGSIGAELCRQLYQLGPAELIMLDRDESALHAIQLALRGRALLDSDETVLADIRDQHRVQEVFGEFRPDIVFHAAALKHLPLLERCPAEAVKSNVWGTLNVLRAAADHGVRSFVNISTDKAASPVSVLGFSKRVAERLTAHMSGVTGDRYLSVRFGNVLGSRGSVLTALSAQVASGGPVTVTHPEVSRYFMIVDEAVHLVLQAAAIGRGGEVLVLDMGKPVRIADIARRLTASTDPKSPTVDIVFTGLRPGEKLTEDRLGPGETDHRPCHPLICQVPVPPLSPDEVLALDPDADAESLRRSLAWCAGSPAAVPLQRGGTLALG